MTPLQIAPNRPLTVALEDPEGEFDFELGIGRYATTTGHLLTLPRPAVVLLNALEPNPGEEIVITKHWSGRPGEKVQWTVALSPRAENARAEAEKLAQEPADYLGVSCPTFSNPNAVVAPPLELRKPARRQTLPAIADQGNGTHGPLPAFDYSKHQTTCNACLIPGAACNCTGPRVPIPTPPRRPERPERIPANIAVREILAFIQDDPNTANWSDQARQDLASTVIISSWKAGYIGLWERSAE
jgi:hypothetical protein